MKKKLLLKILVFFSVFPGFSQTSENNPTFNENVTLALKDGEIEEFSSRMLRNDDPIINLHVKEMPLEIEWEASFGEEDDKSWAVSTIQTSDGGYLLFGDVDFNCSGIPDVMLIKTDHNGNELWRKTYGGDYVEEATVVKQTTDGGFIMGGMTTQFGWSSEGWLIRTDQYGNVIWNKGFHIEESTPGEFDIIQDIIVLDDGNFITVGYSSFTDHVKAWIMKINSNGNVIWNKAYGQMFWSRLTDIIPANDGGYIAIGDKHVTYDDTWYRHDGYLVKFNSIGDTLWTKTFGSDGHDLFRGIVQNTQGDIIIAGQSEVSEQYNGWLVKTDEQGNQIWNNHYGNGMFSCIEMADENRYIASGGVFDPDLAYGAKTIAVDASGNELWQDVIQSTNYDEIATSIRKTKDGGFLIGGRTDAHTQSGKFWMLKLKDDAGNFPVLCLNEDFDQVQNPSLPQGWTGLVDVITQNTIAEVKTLSYGPAPSQPNAVFIMNGLNTSNGTPDADAFVALVSPLVEITENGALLSFFASCPIPVIIGTLNDPEDSSSFSPVKQIDLSSNGATYEVFIPGPFTGHIGFLNSNTLPVYPLFVDQVSLEPVFYPEPLTSFHEDFDQVQAPELPQSWGSLIEVNSLNVTAEVITLADNSSPSQPNSVFINNGSNEDKELDQNDFIALVSPFSVTGTTGSVLSFQAKGDDNIKVGLLENLYDISSFVPVEEITLTSDFSEYTVDFTNPAPGYITFIHANNNPSAALMIDDINFEQIPMSYTLTFAATGNGNISASVNGQNLQSGDQVNEGLDVLLVATPDQDFQIKKWIINGETIFEENELFTQSELVLRELICDSHIEVEFEPIPVVNYYISFDVTGGNGSLAVFVDGEEITSGSQAEEGKDINFVATPQQGYTVKQWKLNGELVYQEGNLFEGDEFLIENISSDVHVTVEFKQNQATAVLIGFELLGGNGAFSATVDGQNVDPGQEIEAGKDINFLVVPDDGYRVKEWKVNNQIIMDDENPFILNELLLEDVMADLFVTVELETSSYTSEPCINDISIFPNPASDKLNLKFVEGVEIVRIYNLSGKLVLENQLDESGSAMLDVSSLNQGFYMLGYFFGDGTFGVKKLVVNK